MYKELDSFTGKGGKISAIEYIPDERTNGKPIKNKYIVMVENYAKHTVWVQKYASAAELFDWYKVFIRNLNTDRMDRGENVLLKQRGEKRFANAFGTPALEMVANANNSFSVYASKPVSACCRRGSLFETNSYSDALEFYKKKEKQLWAAHKHPKMK